MMTVDGTETREAVPPRLPRRLPIGRPAVPQPAGRAAGAIFGTLARLRRDRALHPDGRVFRGEFRAEVSGTGARLFDEVAAGPALVRLSRGVGLPKPAPDVLGCAVRVEDAYGLGAHQDFAFATSGRRPLARNLLVPHRDFGSGFFSSVLPYRLDGRAAMLGAEIEGLEGPADIDSLEPAVRRRGVCVRLLMSTPFGHWHQVATVALLAAVPDGDSDRLRFNPWNSGPGIEPIGIFNRLRDAAYRASQSSSP